jgi:nicotinate-nucleotide adenylyltransferase
MEPRRIAPSLARATHIPPAADGMAIGLFGGSFNPPHEGHVRVAEIALKRARLDRIWWMVTPGNPLKSRDELANLEERLRMSEAIASHPRIVVTALEAGLGTNYSVDTIRILRRIRPRLRFVWIMGADSLANFHEWQNWRRIAAMVPMIVVDRPGSTAAMRSSRAAAALAGFLVDERDAPLIARLEPPAWTFVHGPRSPLSSTQLRKKNKT